MQTSDRERAEYVQEEYGVDWQSPSLYDLIINTSRLSVEAVVSLIVTAARALEVKAPSPDVAYQRLRQEFYAAREAAEVLMLNPEVLRHAVYAGELPASRAGNERLIRRQDLLTWL